MYSTTDSWLGDEGDIDDDDDDVNDDEVES